MLGVGNQKKVSGVGVGSLETISNLPLSVSQHHCSLVGNLWQIFVFMCLWGWHWGRGPAVWPVILHGNSGSISCLTVYSILAWCLFTNWKNPKKEPRGRGAVEHEALRKLNRKNSLVVIIDLVWGFCFKGVKLLLGVLTNNYSKIYPPDYIKSMSTWKMIKSVCSNNKAKTKAACLRRQFSCGLALSVPYFCWCLSGSWIWIIQYLHVHFHLFVLHLQKRCSNQNCYK